MTSTPTPQQKSDHRLALLNELQSSHDDASRLRDELTTMQDGDPREEAGMERLSTDWQTASDRAHGVTAQLRGLYAEQLADTAGQAQRERTTTGPVVSLDAIDATERLGERQPHAPDVSGETQALLTLMRELADHSDRFFDTLVQAVRQLSNGESVGISLLNETIGRFVWPAVAGPLDAYVGQGTPSDFGPCGTVLERRVPTLFVHPERYFNYLEPITPPLEEVLLVPFYMGQKPVGTLWAVIHEEGRQFDPEDQHTLEAFAPLAGSAYRLFHNTGALEAMLTGAPPAAV